ncbi:hypothetical protein ACWEK5_28600 [Rhodococcus koreensis]
MVLYLQGNRLQAAKWHQWKVHLFEQDDFYSTWAPTNVPILYNLEWEPRGEHQVDFPHGWVLHPVAAGAGAFLKSLAVEPPIRPGTPDPYVPPEPGELQPQTHLQIGPTCTTSPPWSDPTTNLRTRVMGSSTNPDERRPGRGLPASPTRACCA